MADVAFIGLGNMGLPMARNLIEKGHSVKGFDLVPDLVQKLRDVGGFGAEDASVCVMDADVIITMLPEGKHVDEVYNNFIFQAAKKKALLIDCSTIDVATSRSVASKAKNSGFEMVDAPVSCGTGGAEAGTLTFMVGGEKNAFEKARPFLEVMGSNIVHTGGAGNGQAAKICNNMILGISMIAVSESYSMAKKLGLDAQTLFNITSSSSSQCWAMTSYLPVPGPVPSSPANNDYQPGFTAAMMAKDMKLAEDAAASVGQHVDLATNALKIYQKYLGEGGASKDFSGVFTMICKSD